ncbi:MAG TPA: zf-HC2 domain-containing protein [Anaerolineales bacterium]|nr:zf-HC2 domain-containing protein [Anaerolineales bacterium]
MNAHLNDGDLRAALDGELQAAARQHLENCPACRQRLGLIQAQVQPIARRLSFLASPDRPAALSAQAALTHFHQFTQPRKELSMFRKLFTSPLVRAGIVIVLILAVVLSLPSTRALAGKFLNLFRVQQVVVVPVDFTGMQQLTGNQALGKQVSDLISSSITSQQKPGSPVTAADAASASRQAGFNVRVPQGLAPTRFSVEGPAAFTLKVDVAKAQALLNESGRSDLVLPASINGADVSVTIPASVSVSFGTCPDPAAQDTAKSLNGNGSAGRQYPDCVILAELPTPTVTAPPELDLAQLAQIGLEFTGMTSDQAAAFTQTVDWTSTLVIPLPKNAATYQQVTVDGVTGTLIQRPADDAPQYVLLWVKNGIIYAISSLGTNSQQAIQMANSLP